MVRVLLVLIMIIAVSGVGSIFPTPEDRSEYPIAVSTENATESGRTIAAAALPADECCGMLTGANSSPQRSCKTDCSTSIPDGALSFPDHRRGAFQVMIGHVSPLIPDVLFRPPIG